MKILNAVPSHMDSVRTNIGFCESIFDQCDRLSNIWVSGNFSKLDLRQLARLHVSFMGALLYTVDCPKRAYNHLMLSLYYAVKGIERLLMLPLSEQEADVDTRYRQPFNVNIYGAQVTCPVLTPEHRFYYSTDWFDHFWTAALLDNQQDMAFLADMRFDPMVHWADDSGRLFSDILVAFFKLEPHDVSQKFQAFSEASEPDKVNAVSFYHTTQIKLPILDVMQHMFAGDEQLYRQSMHRALMSHYEFWVRDELGGDSRGDISFALTALARLAYRQFGYTLGFETGYVPEYFYQTEGQSIDFGPFAAIEIKDV